MRCISPCRGHRRTTSRSPTTHSSGPRAEPYLAIGMPLEPTGLRDAEASAVGRVAARATTRRHCERDGCHHEHAQSHVRHPRRSLSRSAQSQSCLDLRRLLGKRRDARAQALHVSGLQRSRVPAVQSQARPALRGPHESSRPHVGLLLTGRNYGRSCSPGTATAVFSAERRMT